MSVETQLDLRPSVRESPPRNAYPRSVDPPIHFLLELDPEVVKWRRRTMFLTSVFIHILLILLLIFSPDLLRRGQILMGIPVTPKQDQQVTTLFLPPDLLKQLREPPPEARLSDKNRRAQGRSPIVDPNGVHMPYSRGNTPEPEASRGAPPAAPPSAPAPAAPAAPQGGPPAPQQQAPPGPKPDTQTEAQLRMEDVTPPPSGGGGRFRVPSLSPGQVIQQSMQEAARGGYHPESSSGTGGGGDSANEFNNLHPNFSTEAPTILSDTRGVDFGPYLARIVMLVKRNWIAIIPESARLGQKGRVGVVFEILKDGSMPQERLVNGSGSDPLDRAAVNAIHASAPFPPLPAEFTGEHLVLQFIFLYNESPY